MNYWAWIIFINKVLITIAITAWMTVNEPEKQMLVGKLINILHIDSHNDLRKLLASCYVSASERNVNILALCNILFDDLFHDRDLREASRYMPIPLDNECANNTLSSHVEKKYHFNDRHVTMRASVQYLGNWNKIRLLEKAYIESYILFEVEVWNAFPKFLFDKPENYYITALQLGSITYHDVKIYVHSYYQKKPIRVPWQTRTGHHWIFAIRQGSIMDMNKKEMNELRQNYIGRNISIKYMKF